MVAMRNVREILPQIKWNNSNTTMLVASRRRFIVLQQALRVLVRNSSLCLDCSFLLHMYLLTWWINSTDIWQKFSFTHMRYMSSWFTVQPLHVEETRCFPIIVHTFIYGLATKVGYTTIRVKVKVKQFRYRPGGPGGFQEVKIPRFRDSGAGWW